MPRTMPRAPAFWSGATESSRSRIRQSAAVLHALSNFRVLSPGTNRNERIALRLRLAVHQAGAAADRHHFAALVGGGVLELDDALIGPRLALAFGDDFGVGLQRVTVEHRLWKLHLG